MINSIRNKIKKIMEERQLLKKYEAEEEARIRDAYLREKARANVHKKYERKRKKLNYE